MCAVIVFGYRVHVSSAILESLEYKQIEINADWKQAAPYDEMVANQNQILDPIQQQGLKYIEQVVSTCGAVYSPCQTPGPPGSCQAWGSLSLPKWRCGLTSRGLNGSFWEGGQGRATGEKFTCR